MAALRATERNDRAIVGNRRSPVAFSLVLLLAAALHVPPARAAEGIWVRWSDCAPGGFPQLNYNCAVPTFSRNLYVTAAVAGGLDQVVGASVVFDVVTSTPSLPSWWRLAPGECRAGKLGADTDFSGAFTCEDAWGGQGGALLQFVGQRPGSAANQMRFIATAGVLGVNAVTLTAGEPRAIVFAYMLLGDSASPTCPGCDVGACIVVNSVELVRTPGAPGGDLTLSQAGEPDSNFASWQSGAGCVAVPVLKRSWGQVKALYH